MAASRVAEDETRYRECSTSRKDRVIRHSQFASIIAQAQDQFFVLIWHVAGLFDCSLDSCIHFQTIFLGIFGHEMSKCILIELKSLKGRERERELEWTETILSQDYRLDAQLHIPRRMNMHTDQENSKLSLISEASICQPFRLARDATNSGRGRELNSHARVEPIFASNKKKRVEKGGRWRKRRSSNRVRAAGGDRRKTTNRTDKRLVDWFRRACTPALPSRLPEGDAHVRSHLGLLIISGG